MNTSLLETTIRSLGQELNFDSIGVTPLQKPLSLEFYKTWLAEGLNSDMNYLKEHLPFKESPSTLMPFAKSTIVVSKNYFDFKSPDFPLTKLSVARYARGEDYHRWLLSSLKEYASRLKKEFPEHEFFCATDAFPVMERDLAYQAGLGWFGKNTCLIDRGQGSFFLLGEIFTSLEVKANNIPSPDFCGTCNKCIESCPTQALDPEKGLDANKCISYWTIESRKVPPSNIRSQMSDLFFGCDICQDVCPWNQKKYPELKKTDFKNENREELIRELKLILNSSNKQLESLFKTTPLSRAGGRGLKRNALIVIGNLNLYELEPEVSQFTSHELLAELASWTLSLLAKPS